MTDHPSQQEADCSQRHGLMVALPWKANCRPCLSSRLGLVKVQWLICPFSHLNLWALNQWLKWPGPSACRSLSRGIYFIFSILVLLDDCSGCWDLISFYYCVLKVQGKKIVFSGTCFYCLHIFQMYLRINLLSWYFHVHLFFNFSCTVDFSIPGRGSIFLFSISLPTVILLESCMPACMLLVNASFPRKEVRKLCVFKATSCLAWSCQALPSCTCWASWVEFSAETRIFIHSDCNKLKQRHWLVVVFSIMVLNLH